MLYFDYLDRRTTDDHLGLIPSFLSVHDPRPAKEQFDQNYRHGGGWSPYPKGSWTMAENHTIKYPGDDRMKPLASAQLRDETIFVYEMGIVAIVQKDGSFEVARMD